MKLLTVDEMRQLEKAADEAGLSYAEMMENAGRAVALAIKERFPKGGWALVLVGPGNNGGDGLVAARYLHEWGFDVVIYIWKRARKEDPNLDRVQERGLPIFRSGEDEGWKLLEERVRRCDILIDALLGTGAKGELRGDLPELLKVVRRALGERVQREGKQVLHTLYEGQRARDRGPFIVAVDVPSGLDSDTGTIDERALPADLTVTFAYPKRGHFLFPGGRWVGELLVADIGIDPRLVPETLEVATAQEIAKMLPARPIDAHKGTFGKVLVVGGSTNYVGAPCLAAEAAYRSGAGLVTLAVPQPIYPSVAAKLTEATFVVLPSDLGALVPEAVRVLADWVEGYQVLLLGPGLGQDPKTGEFVRALVHGEKKPGAKRVGFEVSQEEPEDQEISLPPLVLDADALNLLAQDSGWWEGLPANSVLTPHPGEMARLWGCEVQEVQRNRLDLAQQAAAKWGCTVLLKGAYSIVASPDGRTMVIPFANPTLATAGTGDVLAGTVAGLMAQGLASYEAAVCGAFLHGLAGELRREERGSVGMLAGELLEYLPKALEQLRR